MAPEPRTIVKRMAGRKSQPQKPRQTNLFGNIIQAGLNAAGINKSHTRQLSARAWKRALKARPAQPPVHGLQARALQKSPKRKTALRPQIKKPAKPSERKA